MARVRMRNRISAILLQSDTTLTSEQIHSVYPGQKPSIRSIVGLLSAYPEFVEMGTVFVPRKRGSGNSPATKWTHIDHALFSPKEEE
jgi:hypothetical protein